MSAVRLSSEDVERIAFYLAKSLNWSEVIPRFSTRYPNVLESCLQTPFTTFDGIDLYPTIYDKAGILFYLMNKNHPFRNGNKRLAVTTLLVFLFLNGYWIEISHEDLYLMAIEIAESDMSQKDQVVNKLNRNLKKICLKLSNS